VGRVHQRAIDSESRVPIEADFWFVWTLGDGKVVRLDMYATEADALAAAGLGA
jgi:hypothetical protein